MCCISSIPLHRHWEPGSWACTNVLGIYTRETGIIYKLKKKRMKIVKLHDMTRLIKFWLFFAAQKNLISSYSRVAVEQTFDVLESEVDSDDSPTRAQIPQVGVCVSIVQYLYLYFYLRWDWFIKWTLNFVPAPIFHIVYVNYDWNQCSCACYLCRLW